MPDRLYAWIGRHAAWLPFAGVPAGLAVPPLAALLWPAVLPVTFLLFVASLLRMDMGLALSIVLMTTTSPLLSSPA
ncbi:MAG: hypothetical protein L6R19_17075 [Alphaproteobacteria bacterium]|nr:hypothetical protein [Alphaproteobacteria bacterium]